MIREKTSGKRNVTGRFLWLLTLFLSIPAKRPITVAFDYECGR